MKIRQFLKDINICLDKLIEDPKKIETIKNDNIKNIPTIQLIQANRPKELVEQQLLNTNVKLF